MKFSHFFHSLNFFFTASRIALCSLLFLLAYSHSAYAQGTVAILHTFGDGTAANDGRMPESALLLSNDGNFYGTTYAGGTAGFGTVYKMTPAGVVTILHSFGDGTIINDGENPQAALVSGGDGSFYGTTDSGGSTHSGGATGDGTVFKITPSGDVTILHSFDDGTIVNDGRNPHTSLVLGSDGNFYGTTYAGGTAGLGTVYKMTPDGVLSILHSFGDGAVTNDGEYPVTALTLGKDGSFYGTTRSGGSNIKGGLSNAGTVFSITLQGAETILHSFLDGSVVHDGIGPDSALIEGSISHFYGVTSNGGSTAYGNVFEITVPASQMLSHTHLLWNNTSGAASLWTINPDGSHNISPTFGPYPGWSAKALSAGPDGLTHLLWTHTNGAIALWNVAPAGTFTQNTYGPFPSYAAVSLSTGTDGQSHLLWDKTDGAASLWSLNTATGAYTYANYGPFPGWTASVVASGAATTDLLWNSSSGQASGWKIAANGTRQNFEYGPYAGWGATALSVGADEGAHLLWDNLDGTTALWSVDFGSGGFTQGVYGPFGGWSACAIGTGPDGTTRVLWKNGADGQASVWSLSGGVYTHAEYGPYSGWSAVALCAGP